MKFLRLAAASACKAQAPNTYAACSLAWQQNPPKKKTETHAGSVGFLHVLFFPFFSILSFPNVQKLRENQKKKNNPVRRILGKSM